MGTPVQVGTQPTLTIQPASALLPVGTTTFGSLAVPAAYSTVTLTLPRNAGWAASAGVEILELILDVSFDSGVTWQVWCGFGVAGGPISGTAKGGLPYTLTTHTFVHALPTPCTVRGRLLNKTGAILTALSVTAGCN